jgi:type IV pilus assembly protein PilW
MSTNLTHRRPVPMQRGFTLVELMVTVAIALFLLMGLITITQNVRTANVNQQKLAQLQDEQRFAMTVITDAIQAGGYIADPVSMDASANFGAVNGFSAGVAFLGTHTVGALDNVAQDTISTRFYTSPGHGPVLCNGADTSAPAAGVSVYHYVTFSLAAGGVLQCQLDGGAPIQLVNGVQAMAIYYGINRQNPNVDYNIDTYATWDFLNPPPAQDYFTISSVRVVLTFTNPMAGQANQPATITTERVIEVMGRGGVHT